MRAASLLVFLSLLASTLGASSLAVQVTVSEGTLAVGTNVTLVSGGVVFAEKKAGLDGYARFSVSDGSYFVQLRRYPYPLHVSLVEVKGDTSITLTMRQLISYANAYGQIFGPSDFSNVTVTAYSNGLIAKRISANGQGFYAISYLPEGNYELEFSAPGYSKLRKEAFLPAADFIDISPTLQKTEAAPTPEISIAAPARAEQFSVIEVSLMNGASFLSGQSIAVATPSGNLTVTTGSDGKARINVAVAGTYKFTYGNLAAITAVAGKPPTKQPEPNPGPVEQPIAPPEKGQQHGQGMDAAVVVMLLFFAAIGLVAISIVALRYMRKGRHRK